MPIVLPIPAWSVFGPVPADAPLPTPEQLACPGSILTLDSVNYSAQTLQPVRSQCDLRELLGEPPHCQGRCAWVFAPISNPGQTHEASIGIGADHRFQAWLNGQPLFEGQVIEDHHFPPSFLRHVTLAKLQSGVNMLAIRFTSGRASSILAIAGPHELADGDDRSVLDDPLRRDPRWTRPSLHAAPGTKPATDIGTRRELFVDDFLTDTLAGTARRRLHHPSPREIVLTMDRPWEGNFSGNFLPVTVFEYQKRFYLYYYAANCYIKPDPSMVGWDNRKKVPTPPLTCLATSDDGIHFTRPSLGLVDIQNSPDNNAVWWGRQYFSPFVDDNPATHEHQRFKAITGHPQGGLAVCASPDGIHWNPLVDKPVITKGAFDSQNLAFWDGARGCYVEYHRGQPPHRRERGIMTSTSPDAIHWDEPSYVEYRDHRLEDMYTNCIRPYARAPHIYLGTPARYVMHRTKVAHHPEYGISDSILMSSRDGVRFERWEAGLVRPDTQVNSWTDRNNYLAWGMLQTAEDELSLYWCENNGHPLPRIRRGVLRVDGFASLHAPADGPGEWLSRPLLMSGSRLELNCATSAIGTILIEICDESGNPLPKLSLADCDPIFGNELSLPVRWQRKVPNLSSLARQPIRLRIRLHDADVFAFRFT